MEWTPQLARANEVFRHAEQYRIVKQYARPIWVASSERRVINLSQIRLNGVRVDKEPRSMSGVQSIERAFAILRALARGAVGVTEIADRTELPKSTVSRLLAALETEGAVEQAESGEYAIGPALATLGDVASPTATLRMTIRPYLEELAAATGGNAGFTVLDGRMAYWVDNVDEGDELVTLADQTGQSFPLHSIPSGLALLSRFDSDALEAYLNESDEHAIDDPDQLRARIAEIDRSGLVVSREELDAGVNAFAAPFRGPSGEWEGALYLQGPSFRFPGDVDDDEVVQLVTTAVDELSSQLLGR